MKLLVRGSSCPATQGGIVLHTTIAHCETVGPLPLFPDRSLGCFAFSLIGFKRILFRNLISGGLN